MDFKLGWEFVVDYSDESPANLDDVLLNCLWLAEVNQVLEANRRIDPDLDRAMSDGVLDDRGHIFDSQISFEHLESRDLLTV